MMSSSEQSGGSLSARRGGVTMVEGEAAPEGLRDPRAVPAPWVAEVDAENRFRRWVSRAAVARAALVHRSVQVAIFSRSGALLLQRRSAAKRFCPGHWDLSCAGHIDAGDYAGDPDTELDLLYSLAAARELREELGIEVPLTFLDYFAPREGVHEEHFALFYGHSEGPFELQESEVDEVAWFDRSAWDTLCATPGELLTPSLRLLAPQLLALSTSRSAP